MSGHGGHHEEPVTLGDHLNEAKGHLWGIIKESFGVVDSIISGFGKAIMSIITGKRPTNGHGHGHDAHGGGHDAHGGGHDAHGGGHDAHEGGHDAHGGGHDAHGGGHDAHGGGHDAHGAGHAANDKAAHGDGHAHAA